MSELENRLELMKAYRAAAIAEQDPSHRLYIEDLDLSVAMFEKQASVNKDSLTLRNGWVDSD